MFSLTFCYTSVASYGSFCSGVSPGTHPWLSRVARDQGCSRTLLSYMAESILTSITLAGGSFNVFYDTILAQGTAGSKNDSRNHNFTIPSGWKCLLITTANYRDSYILLNPIAVFVPNIDVYGLCIITNNGTYDIMNVGHVSETRFDIETYTQVSYTIIA